MAVVLGLNSFHAGASAALVIDGVPVAAIAEERLNRVKYYAKFPTQAINKCLEMAGIGFLKADAMFYRHSCIPHCHHQQRCQG